jgi:hypothetical protein
MIFLHNVTHVIDISSIVAAFASVVAVAGLAIHIRDRQQPVSRSVVT